MGGHQRQDPFHCDADPVEIVMRGMKRLAQKLDFKIGHCYVKELG